MFNVVFVYFKSDLAVSFLGRSAALQRELDDIDNNVISPFETDIYEYFLDYRLL